MRTLHVWLSALVILAPYQCLTGRTVNAGLKRAMLKKSTLKNGNMLRKQMRNKTFMNKKRLKPHVSRTLAQGSRLNKTTIKPKAASPRAMNPQRNSLKNRIRRKSPVQRPTRNLRGPALSRTKKRVPNKTLGVSSKTVASRMISRKGLSPHKTGRTKKVPVQRQLTKKSVIPSPPHSIKGGRSLQGSSSTRQYRPISQLTKQTVISPHRSHKKLNMLSSGNTHRQTQPVSNTKKHIVIPAYGSTKKDAKTSAFSAKWKKDPNKNDSKTPAQNQSTSAKPGETPPSGTAQNNDSQKQPDDDHAKYAHQQDNYCEQDYYYDGCFADCCFARDWWFDNYWWGIGFGWGYGLGWWGWNWWWSPGFFFYPYFGLAYNYEWPYFYYPGYGFPFDDPLSAYEYPPCYHRYYYSGYDGSDEAAAAVLGIGYDIGDDYQSDLD